MMRDDGRHPVMALLVQTWSRQAKALDSQKGFAARLEAVPFQSSKSKPFKLQALL